MESGYCPQIEGLHMPDLIEFIQDKNRKWLLDYFPDIEDIPKCGKKWVVDIIQTNCHDDFKVFVKKKEIQRQTKIDA